MSFLNYLYQQIPAYIRNRYAITALLFAAWMLFFDTSNVFSQLEMHRQINDMKQKKIYYREQISEVQKSLKDLLTDDETLERFAREKYLMKRPEEDIFIIHRKEERGFFE